MGLADDKRVDLVAEARENLDTTDTTTDSDGDGASDADERRDGTDPHDAYDTRIDLGQLEDSRKADVREDGAEDREIPNKQFWEERFEHRENPDGSVTITQRDRYDAPTQLPDTVTNLKGLDSDGDGLSDLDEYNRKTDPTNPDTDRDGRPDGAELEQGFDPTWPEPPNATKDDSDGDGVTNDQEARYAGPRGIDMFAAAGKGSDAVEGRQRAFDERKTGDAVGDAALQKDLGIEPTADDIDKLVTDIGDDIFSSDPIDRARADMALSGFDESKYDPKIQDGAQQEINDRVQRATEEALATRDPQKAIAVMRQHELMGQGDHPDHAELNEVVLERFREGYRHALESDDPIDAIGVSRQAQLLGAPLEDLSDLDDHIADIANRREAGLPTPGGPQQPMPDTPPRPGQTLPGPGQAPGQGQPGPGQRQQPPQHGSPQAPSPGTDPAPGRGATEPSDRRIGTDPADPASAEPAGGPGRAAGDPGPGAQSGAGSALGSDIDNALANLGTGTTSEPSGLTGPRSTEQPAAGSGLSIGSLGTKNEGIGNSPPAGGQAGGPGGPRPGGSHGGPADTDGSGPAIPIMSKDGESIDHFERTNADGSMTILTADGKEVFNVPAKKDGTDTSAEAADDTNPNSGTTDNDDSSDDAGDGESSDLGDGEQTDVARVDPGANEGGDATGLRRFDFLATAGSSVVDSRYTNTGRPDSPAFGPDTTVPVGQPTNPGDETPQDDATTVQPGSLDETRLPGYGTTTVRPELVGLGPELDPNQLDPGGQTGGDREGSGGGNAYDPSTQAHGGGIDMSQGAGLGGPGPGGLDVNLELAEPSTELHIQGVDVAGTQPAFEIEAFMPAEPVDDSTGFDDLVVDPPGFVSDFASDFAPVDTSLIAPAEEWNSEGDGFDG